jgi:DNA-binding IscR family transcriptional regulator
MFMAANSLLASAVQILCFLAYVDDEGANAERVAKSLRTNPVVVRRILKMLEHRNLVSIRQGRHGGVALARDPKDVSLQDISAALDEDSGLFSLRKRGNPRCPVNNAMKDLLTPVFLSADAAVANSLRQTKLASLIAKIP